MQNITLTIDGMSCDHCELAVQMAVSGVPGVKRIQTSGAKNQAYVEFDPSTVDIEKIKSAIDEIGYNVLE